MTCTLGHPTRPKAPASTVNSSKSTLFGKRPALVVFDDVVPKKNNGADSKKEQEQASVKALAFLFPLKDSTKKPPLPCPALGSECSYPNCGHFLE